MMDRLATEDEVLVTRQGSAAIILLNRPRALNSLTPDMVNLLKQALANLEHDDSVSCVVLTGAGGRALCAGGDIRALYNLGRSGDPHVTDFWRDEFPLNLTIARYRKPYVVLMDGITMGGGVGLSSHGRHRIVTGRTRLAMPETAIGYFPDVGATWLLPRAPGETGTWLGLTGNEIGGSDAIHAGLADYHVSHEACGSLIDALAALAPGSTDEQVAGTIRDFTSAAFPGVLASNQALIDRTFSAASVDEIIARLAAEEDRFALETLESLGKRSPTSLRLTLRLLREGRESKTLVECLEREFVAGCVVLRGHDFYEGVRAAIIDKDRSPAWLPANLAEVDDAAIDRYFVPGERPVFSGEAV